MATTAEVLRFLIPDGGYTAMGEDYEGIDFVECSPISKTEFEAAFAKCDAAKIAADKKTESDITAILARLGVTLDEFKLLLG